MEHEASALGKLSPGRGPPPRLANELYESNSWLPSFSIFLHLSKRLALAGALNGDGHSPRKPTQAGLCARL